MNTEPILPAHPGELLREWISGKRMSVVDLASLLEITADELNLILSCQAPLPAALAVRLETIGWGKAECWSGTQVIRDIAQTRHELGVPVQAVENSPPRRNVDLGFDVRLGIPSSPKPVYGPPCASIVIASSGSDTPVRHQTRFGKIRSRSGACLKHTSRDAESVHAHWREQEPSLPDELQVLLIDPTIDDVERAMRSVSNQIRKAYPDDIGLDLFFAGHGEEGTGNLVLRGGTLSPTRFLELQADDVGLGAGDRRTIRVCLDSCYSGEFLLRLAIESFEDFEGFRLEDGLASCLPNESSYEFEFLEHGVFTFTYLHEGNSYVDRERFNQAILHNDHEQIVKGLQGLVGMMSNASAFLTEGRQFSMSVMRHVIDVAGGFATLKLGEQTDLAQARRRLTSFAQARVGSSSATAKGKDEEAAYERRHLISWI